MSVRTFPWRCKRFTGLTGNASVQFVPYDFQSFGVTNPCRVHIAVSGVALALGDVTSSYSTQFMADTIFTWNPSLTTGTIVKEANLVNDGSSHIQWNRSGSGVHGSYQLQVVGLSTTATFSIVCAARIVNFVEY